MVLINREKTCMPWAVYATPYLGLHRCYYMLTGTKQKTETCAGDYRTWSWRLALAVWIQNIHAVQENGSHQILDWKLDIYEITWYIYLFSRVYMTSAWCHDGIKQGMKWVCTCLSASDACLKRAHARFQPCMLSTCMQLAGCMDMWKNVGQ
jgi:hypothetical protein